MAKLVSTNGKLKKPMRSTNNIFTLYSPRSTCIERADNWTIDTELILHLPNNSNTHSVSKFEGQKIKTIIGPKTERLWLTLLNESYFEKYKIKRRDIIGYLVIKPEDLKVQMRKSRLIKHGDIQITIYPKTGRSAGKSTGRRKKQRMSRPQTGSFLSRYDFAYAGRDTVNQVGKIAPDIINEVSGGINKIAQERIDQAIRSRGAEIERVAIEDVYKTPFRLLGNLGKKQFQKIKRKLFK